MPTIGTVVTITDTPGPSNHPRPSATRLKCSMTVPAVAEARIGNRKLPVWPGATEDCSRAAARVLDSQPGALRARRDHPAVRCPAGPGSGRALHVLFPVFRTAMVTVND